MSPFSAPVLGAATVLASSALWQALVDETLSLEVALTRFVVAAVVAWVALSALGALVGSPMASQGGGPANGSGPSTGPGDAGATGTAYDAGQVT
ncbi:hypothetical protein [Nocardioides rubriscoriae]|uniref:hypothetical protein n=1 Tax=Nocardioides rubriscoriae TaxID=642762 RepID=UPI0011E057F5|nr:hypothetical protein [Nocardioides rubriscoriae]